MKYDETQGNAREKAAMVNASVTFAGVAGNLLTGASGGRVVSQEARRPENDDSSLNVPNRKLPDAEF